MKRPIRCGIVILALLAVLLGIPVAAAQTVDEAVAAYGRGDYATAVRGFLVHAEQGDSIAQFILGLMYAKGEGVLKDEAEAARWYRLAAEQGVAIAQYNLGLMYDNGEGVLKDEAEAARWYRLAAEQGHADAQNNLGLMYDNGEGVLKDDAEAVRWFRLAAEHGFSIAQYNLGLMYAKGEGVLKDDAEAVRWFRLAAEQGHASSQGVLGAMYMNGQGVPQDDEIAHVWLNVAASRSTGEQRDEYVEARDAVAERMTRGQLAEAQRRAREWDEASRLFPTNDSTRTTSENPSVNPSNFEYGDESELRGVKTVYLDTGFELKARNVIVDKLTADTVLVVVDRPQEADVVLVFRWDGEFGTIAKGYAIIGNRLVWEFKDRRLSRLQRLPSTNFARNFLKLIK